MKHTSFSNTASSKYCKEETLLSYFVKLSYLKVVGFGVHGSPTVQSPSLQSLFTFQYPRSACSIQLEDKVILTGGVHDSSAMTKVTVYNSGGFVEDKPPLNTGRYYHGCGHYVNTDNKMVRQHCHCNIICVLLMAVFPVTVHCTGVPCGRRLQ